jgi:hypothetical protein
MLTNLTKTQRAVLVCVVERGDGGWLSHDNLRYCVPERAEYSAERMRLYGLLYVQRMPYRGGWRKSWKPTPLGMLVYRGIKAEGNDGIIADLVEACRAAIPKLSEADDYAKNLIEAAIAKAEGGAA